jgi:hypothetical protein
MVFLVSVVLVLLAIPSVDASPYTFVPIVVPFAGAHETTVTGLTRDGTIVGTYVDAEFHTQGFVWRPGDSAQLLPLVRPRGVSPDGTRLVGFYVENNTFQGFILEQGTVSVLPGPGTPRRAAMPPRQFPANAAALGITDAGIVVGFYQEADAGLVHHGFAYDPPTRQYTTVDFAVPGAVSSGVISIGPTGTILGFVLDALNTPKGVLQEGATLTVLEAPGTTTGTMPVGLAADGTVALAADGRGVLYHAGVYTSVDMMPGATWLQPFGMRSDGVLYGQVRTATARSGFLAYPAGVAVPQRKE